jgi:N-methylhydantoinase A
VVIDGPAIVEEPHSTLLLPPGWRLTAHSSGALIATVANKGA